MPAHTLPTTAVMYTITPEALARNGIDAPQIAGALHAAEHAAIGLLPLVASCDRGDIGGLSAAVGPDPLAGLPSVFVYDGYPGGAGFAERGFRQASTWLSATAAAIEACECPSGCPSCVQSPKCGSGNQPLDKTGAIRVLRLVVAALTRDDDRPLDGRLPRAWR
ncbi:MAG TPA: Zn-binding domain-containing protein, partial [Mycobacterium sp.]|uniref:Zn-binding domain-containing protein n=1 Tax=Mycobacterium sp. TaxID=1785 RepID=UPI002D519A08